MKLEQLQIVGTGLSGLCQRKLLVCQHGGSGEQAHESRNRQIRHRGCSSRRQGRWGRHQFVPQNAEQQHTESWEDYSTAPASRMPNQYLEASWQASCYLEKRACLRLAQCLPCGGASGAGALVGVGLCCPSAPAPWSAEVHCLQGWRNL